MTGKLIVIDGTDGSGKATQTKLLIERMRREGLGSETVSFPQYGKNSAGLVEEYLAGKYGSAKEVGPKRASIFFAIDRYDASFQMKKWLEEGKHIVSDRYVSANMGHQGGKIADPEERKRFFEWADELEYGIFELPRPTLTLILHVAPEVSYKLLDAEKSSTRDIHELDLDHLRQAEAAYLDMVKLFPDFKLVECVENGAILPIESIQEKIWAEVNNYL
ncbi:MAG: thymidylate kinase [bacterium]